MSTNKFLSILNGVTTLFTAIATSAGAGDASKIVMTNGSGVLDTTLMPPGIGADTSTVLASENLSAGDFVNIYNNSGTPNCRKADASNGRDANGFVLSAVTSGNNATVYRLGTNNQQSSLVPGTTYYLSASTAGGATATAPSSSGQIVQELGTAFSSTELVFVDRGVISIT